MVEVCKDGAGITCVAEKDLQGLTILGCVAENWALSSCKRRRRLVKPDSDYLNSVS